MDESIIENGDNLLARLKGCDRPSIKNIFPEFFGHCHPQSKQIIEITGDTKVGKTLLLLEIISKIILPKEYGGKAGSVILLLTENDFQIFKLQRILNRRLRQSKTKGNISQHILQRLTILPCYSVEHFEIALITLEDELLKNQNYCLLALDSISAFYWPNCPMDNPIRASIFFRNSINKFKGIIQKHRLVFIYTKISGLGPEINELDSKYLSDYSIKLIGLDGKHITYVAIIRQQSKITYRRRYYIHNVGIYWIKN